MGHYLNQALIDASSEPTQLYAKSWRPILALFQGTSGVETFIVCTMGTLIENSNALRTPSFDDIFGSFCTS